MFFDSDKFGKDDKMFSFWFNTSFLRRSTYKFGKASLDGAVKDKKCKYFHKDFSCSMVVEGLREVKEFGPELDENNTPFFPEQTAGQEDDDLDTDEEHEPANALVDLSINTNQIRKLVSKKKIRFQQDGFDLDLAYVGKSCIAMGFPSTGIEGAYRNRMDDTQKFFNTFHKGNHKIYNLCSERAYPDNSFDKCVRYGFNDHNPPPLSVLIDICDDIDVFVNHNTQPNVVAIHCKAGKGRTGTVIASYLQLSGEAKDADEALNLFGKSRTRNNKGVTIPSQQRYVRYYGRYIRELMNSDFKITAPPSVTVTGFLMTHPPNFDLGGGCDPYFKVSFLHF